MTTARSFTVGNLCFSVDEASTHGMFARWRKKRWSVVVSDAPYRLIFRYEEMKRLCDGPILIEADSSSSPQGTYFLVSPEAINPQSAVGEALAEMSFEDGTLILLQGLTVVRVLSAHECEQLSTWLKASVPSA